MNKKTTEETIQREKIAADRENKKKRLEKVLNKISKKK